MFTSSISSESPRNKSGRLGRYTGAEKYPLPSTVFQLLGDHFDRYDNAFPPNLILSDDVRTFYHHYKRLSEFLDNSITGIDFSMEYSPHKLYDINNSIESYYLVDPYGNSAFGWVRNLNHTWYNQYYYDETHYNLTGCTSPSVQSFNIEGLIPMMDYAISFYYTVMGGQTLPTNYIGTSDNQGNLMIDLSSSPLGCDSTDADYAYVASAQQPLRVINSDPPPVKSNPSPVNLKPKPVKVQPLLQFNIYPNPNTGDFSVTVAQSLNDKSSIVVKDITGRELLKYENISTNTINLKMKNFSKGIYFVEVKMNDQLKIKKFIIQ